MIKNAACAQGAAPAGGAEAFDYHKAFDRNIGWLTEEEQEKLRHACVAIAGLGGAGGFQAQALARLGVGRFKIADPDTFEITNINRQVGATQETLGKPKADITRQMILAVNPAAHVEIFPDGVHQENIGRFLEGTDFVIDGIDFFAFETKLLLFRESRSRGLIALTACPLGFGASLILFPPEGMTFEEYFDLRPGMSEKDRRFSLAFGLSPSPLCLRYMNKKASQLDRGRAASVSPGLMLVGAVTGTEAVKCLTGKARPLFAPHVFQVDLFTQKMRKRFYPGGMANPWMRLKKWFVLKIFLNKRI